MSKPDESTIRELQWGAFETAHQKGFHGNWTGSRHDALASLALVHSEVSEAVQEVKRHWNDTDAPNNHPLVKNIQEPELLEKIGDELADILIRVFDFAGLIGVDLQDATMAKMAANKKRPHLYGTPGSVESAALADEKGEAV